MNNESSKEYNLLEIKIPENACDILQQAMKFLQLFLPVTLVKRFVAVILLAVGIPVKDAVELTGLCEKSMWTLKKRLRGHPVSELMTIKSGSGRKSKADGIEKQILSELESGNYRTRQEIADMIEDKFHIKVSRSCVGRFLKKNGFKWLKCGSLPAKADTEKQKKFFDNILNPLMKKAEGGEISLLFLDASHFVMGCDFLGHIYGRVRRYVRTFSGRRRYNVLGALDYVSKKMLVIANDSYITATEVCGMPQKIADGYGDKKVHIILDNARYQKCRIVQELADQLDIHLEYIPPYSPNLNLIERIWKFVKGEISSKYFDDFDAFKQKIDSIISSTDGKNKPKINRLIGKGVQLFYNLVSVGKNTFAFSSDDKNAA